MKRKYIGNTLFFILLGTLVILTLFPFMIMVSGSFKVDMELNRSPMRIIPENPTLVNYQTLFTTIPFFRQLFTSIWLGIVCALGNMLINGVVAYGFVRFDFKGKEVLFLMVLATMLIPGMVFMVPTFKMYSAIGLFGKSYIPLIMPWLTSAFGIYLIRQVMGQIPMEIFESATIDGCSDFRAFLTMAIPLSVSGIGIMGVLTFMGSWNDFMTPLIYLNSESMYTLPLGLMRLQDFYKISYGAPLAGAFLSCLPVIIILTLVGQKYFMQGLMMGAVKG